MMSLFSSFDSKYFSFWSTTLFFLFHVFTILFYKNSSFKFFVENFVSFMEVFFQSTKVKRYTKGALFIIISLLFSLIIMNFSSILSYSYTPTAQISLVLFISMLFWVSLFLFYFVKNMIGFLSHCIPEGSPLGLVILLFLIELVSNLIRPVTLTVRLSANIIAGHVIMSLLFKLAYILPAISILYLIINIAELFVCFIQAWIFSTLIGLYYSEIN